MQDDVHFNLVFKKREKKSLETTETEELLQVGFVSVVWMLEGGGKWPHQVWGGSGSRERPC